MLMLKVILTRFRDLEYGGDQLLSPVLFHHFLMPTGWGCNLPLPIILPNFDGKTTSLKFGANGGHESQALKVHATSFASFKSSLEMIILLFLFLLPPQAPTFLTSEASSVGGFYDVNRRGQVLLATANESTIVPFVSGQLNNLKLAINLAKRGNLPGASLSNCLMCIACVRQQGRIRGCSFVLRACNREEARMR
ncbi:hypothetical protein Lser_V15G17230 [Lactuca serriola]